MVDLSAAVTTVSETFKGILGQVENLKVVELAAETAVAQKELARITIGKALRDLAADIEKLRAEIGPIPEDTAPATKEG